MSTHADIKEGDYVGTKFRGGTRQGIVECIQGDRATFTDQHGHKVTHKLTTLAKDPERSPSSKHEPEEQREHEREEFEKEVGGRK